MNETSKHHCSGCGKDVDHENWQVVQDMPTRILKSTSSGGLVHAPRKEWPRIKVEGCSNCVRFYRIHGDFPSVFGSNPHLI